MPYYNDFEHVLYALSEYSTVFLLKCVSGKALHFKSSFLKCTI
uniref:Uncharacterized protein n=1 Tax=Anguilla anguilla TaxID=7936 RepID=A0A0E9QHM2_ANGAN